jgi:4'-phosphopantetheinyl transferase
MIELAGHRTRQMVTDNVASIFQFQLPGEEDCIKPFGHCLSDDEINRAESFRVRCAKQHYIHVRATLRRLLGLILEIAPQDVVFGYSPTGKPFISEATSGGRTIQFNVSHCDDVALIGICEGAEIGVDIESIDQRIEVDEIAALMLAQNELAGISRYTARERRLGILRAWTRKEAIVKAIGCGFSVDPRDIVVDVGPQARPELIELPEEIGKASTWKVFDLPLGLSHVGALAVPSLVASKSTIGVSDICPVNGYSRIVALASTTTLQRADCED